MGKLTESNELNAPGHQQKSIETFFLNTLESCIELNKNCSNLKIMGVHQFEIFLLNEQHLSPFFCTVDLKEGRAYRGKAMDNLKIDCFYLIEGNDLIKLFTGQLDFAQAYLTGKLKISGNTAFAFKFQNFIKDALKRTQFNSNEAINFEIPVDGLKSDVLLEMIQNRLSNEPELVQKISFVIQINLTQKRNTQIQQIATWTLDTKIGGGRIYRSAPNNGIKPDAIITIEDNDFALILFGKLNPQRIFMSGKMKIKGNIMLLQRLNQLWNKIQTSHQGQDYKLMKDILYNSQLKPGLKSEQVFFILLRRLVDRPKESTAKYSIHIIIMKNDEYQVDWELCYDQYSQLNSINHNLLDQQFSIKIINRKNNLAMVISDDYFTNIVLNNRAFTLEQAIATKNVHLIGDFLIKPKLFRIFSGNIGKKSDPKLIKAKL